MTHKKKNLKFFFIKRRKKKKKRNENWRRKREEEMREPGSEVTGVLPRIAGEHKFELSRWHWQYRIHDEFLPIRISTLLFAITVK